MKRLLLNITLLMFVGFAYGQSSVFNNVYHACVKASDALANGFADSEQLMSSATTLKQSHIQKLALKQTQGEKLSLKGHLYFSAAFIEARIKDETIYDMAEEYECKRKRDVAKGNQENTVLLTTVVIPAHTTYIYEIGGCSDEVSVGCVAETNGKMSWKVKTVGYKSKKSTTYKDNLDEKRGRVARRQTVKCGERYKIVLEITNTTKQANSYAIMAR